ncbi:hypothetical protein [Pseudomonas sp. 30_B]|uniref:hypothetical protein n=2 Tax=Pseudomonas TaxID=286 RepID=UPI001A9DE3B8|nr:hypothetical protein [Pseudomonas sp. 30_B]
MKSPTSTLAPVLAGMLALLGMVAAYVFGAMQQREDVWCSSQFVQPLDAGGQPRWLLAQLMLELGSDGQGALRIRGRVLDDEGKVQAYMHRYAALRYSRDGARLRLSVERAGRSRTDSLADSQIPMISLSLFQPGAEIGLRLERLGSSAYLIDNGLGSKYYCKVTPAQLADAGEPE